MGTAERSFRLSSTTVALMLVIASPVLAQDAPPVLAGDADTVYVASPTAEKETDRASILAALEEVRPGGTVQFAPGTYLVGEFIRVSVPLVTLQGHPEGTTLRGCDPADFEDIEARLRKRRSADEFGEDRIEAAGGNTDPSANHGANE